MNISHTKVELYNVCGYKYKLKYIDKWDVDKIFSPLLFGSSIDEALNYILIQVKNKGKVDNEEAKRLFQNAMSKWNGQNELVFYKSEIPEYCDANDEDIQQQVWKHLCRIGFMMVDTYITEVLPLFDSILEVQVKRNITNEEGDVLILVVDFVAKLKDNTIITIDNKTSSDIKKNYPKTSVKKSNQLAIYSEYEQNRNAAYLVMQKKLKDGKIEWKFIQDIIPDEQINKAFDLVDNTLRAIKREEFTKNEKGCWKFGKLCEYHKLCKQGNPEGLIRKK